MQKCKSKFYLHEPIIHLILTLCSFPRTFASITDMQSDSDFHKLTFFYYSDVYINFRQLISDLFRTYKVRIWMSAVNPASLSNASAAGPVPPPRALGPGAVGIPGLNDLTSLPPQYQQQPQQRPQQQQQQQHHTAPAWPPQSPLSGLHAGTMPFVPTFGQGGPFSPTQGSRR